MLYLPLNVLLVLITFHSALEAISDIEFGHSFTIATIFFHAQLSSGSLLRIYRALAAPLNMYGIIL